MEDIVLNPDNITIATVNRNGLHLKQDVLLSIGDSYIRSTEDELIFNDRENGGLSLSEIAKICQGNSYDNWIPAVYLGENICELEIEDAVYSKIGNLVFVSASIKIVNIQKIDNKILIAGLPYISSHNSELSGINGFVKKYSSIIEIREFEMINNEVIINFSVTYII